LVLTKSARAAVLVNLTLVTMGFSRIKESNDDPQENGSENSGSRPSLLGVVLAEQRIVWNYGNGPTTGTVAGAQAEGQQEGEAKEIGKRKK
jgi:hypothetical protein